MQKIKKSEEKETETNQNIRMQKIKKKQNKSKETAQNQKIGLQKITKSDK